MCFLVTCLYHGFPEAYVSFHTTSSLFIHISQVYLILNEITYSKSSLNIDYVTLQRNDLERNHFYRRLIDTNRR